jgi:uncharacterized protein (TIGR00730 family)
MKKVNIVIDEPIINTPIKGNFIARGFRIMLEFVRGFFFMRNIKKSATFFGSARTKEQDYYYKEARQLAGMLAKQGFSIVTGGGPGIMEAANRGAKENDGSSIGFNIQLPQEQRTNDYLTKGIGFHYFFTRKVMLSFTSAHYIFFPGGYGTLDEFFEIIVLVQTCKLTRPITITLVGRDYWAPLIKWLQESLLNGGYIRRKDLTFFYLVDSAEEAFSKIKEIDND